MVIYTGDRNKVAMIMESGTYATTSGTGIWLGLVQEHSIDESYERASIRYQGSDSRNVQQFVETLIDIKGTLTYYPQDWRLLGFALGSIVDAGSPIPYTHAISETIGAAGNAFTSGIKAPFLSFALEDSKQHNPTGLNFIRTIKGCTVDTLTISSKQGEPISVEAAYVAQSATFSSGATTAVTADSNRPFIWADSLVHMPSGTIWEEITEWSLKISNNIEAPHYNNGSRVIGQPHPLNRDYELTMTYQANSQKSKTLYDQYFTGGSEFNVLISITPNAGSRYTYITLSGCEAFPVDTPGPVEGIVEHSATIVPKTCVVSVGDFTQKYNAW
jgi:hypothetical protein